MLVECTKIIVEKGKFRRRDGTAFEVVEKKEGLKRRKAENNEEQKPGGNSGQSIDTNAVSLQMVAVGRKAQASSVFQFYIATSPPFSPPTKIGKKTKYLLPEIH